MQVFTIFIETFTTPDPAFTEVGEATGGGVLTAADPDEVVAALLKVITPPPTTITAQPDLFVLDENDVLNASVFTDNGSGPDTGSSLVVALVNGLPAPVGGGFPGTEMIYLPSGATAQIRTDGTVIYNPGENFGFMPDPLSGASNGVLIDTVNYTL